MEYYSSDTETDITSSIHNGDSDTSEDSYSDAGSYYGNATEKPLQIVKLSRSTDGEDTLKLTLIPDALDKVLSTCDNHRICVISVVGGIRSGKSFLLNCIKEQLKDLEEGETHGGRVGHAKIKAYRGFPFKSGYKPITKGIWLWSRAFIVEDDEDKVAVLLMDTEGINDELSKPDELAAILGISLLSSSLFIVNATGELTMQEFDWLSRFFGKGGQQFQKISFLVRDWTRVGTHKHGQRGGKKYLDKLIRQNGSRCGVVTNNFQEADCFLLPHIGERPLLEGFSGQVSEISKEFSKSLKSYLKNLFDSNRIPTKKIFENEVKPQEFKAFFLEYTKIFGDGQDLEMGPKPESLMSATRKVAGQIKISWGLEEYLKTFTNKRRATFQESTLDGLHVTARKKALQAFKKFPLPVENERHFGLLFDQELKKKLLELKSNNMTQKEKKVSENLDMACSKMSRELKLVFPFIPPNDMNFSEELVFYNAEILQSKQEQTRDSVVQEFLDEFVEEDDDERAKLQQMLQSKLAKIEEEFTEKNNANQNRAVDKANTLMNTLVNEYSAGMQKKLKRVPNAEAHILDVFHDEEVEKVERKFNRVTLGVAEFQEEWLENLKKSIEIEYESMQGNLESKMAKAKELISEEEKNYRQLLTGIMLDQVQEEVVQVFHLESVESIVKDFVNPFSKNSPNSKEVEKQLREKLDQVYQSIVVGGALEKIKREDEMSKAVDAAVDHLQADLDRSIQENDFLGENECRQFIHTTKEKIVNWFLEELAKIGIAERESIDKGKEQLKAKVTKLLSPFQKKNQETEKVLLEEAEKLLKAGVDEYEKKIKVLKKTIDTLDELEMEHEKIKQLVTDQFTMRFPIKNRSVRREYFEKFENQIQENFKEMENILSMKLKVVDASYNSARHQAEKHYQENMEKKFSNNKHGYFKEEELDKMHLSLHAAAIASVKVDPPLNDFQWKKLNEQMNKLHLKYKQKNELTKHSFIENEPAIGIDLGTTYCCVAAYHRGSVRILTNGQGNNTTPSYVAINADGSAMVGQPAKEQAYRNPDTTIFDAKRIIGRRLDEEQLQEDMKFWPFSVEDVEGKAKIKVWDKHYYPEQISAMLLAHLKKEAEERLGLKVKKAVITVPAYFTDGQRQATIDAGEIAGLEVLGILNEPTAAAIAYRLESFTAGKSRKILVYDLGGGTFDVAVLEISDNKIDVLSICGDSHLGGEDFDKNSMKYCAEEFHKTTEVDLFEGKDSEIRAKRSEARRRLKRLQNECEKTKKALTNQSKREVPVTISIDEIVRGQDMHVDISRKVFDEKNMALFKKTIEIVDEAIQSAGLEKDEIDDVVMVGGSTRVTKLQEMLEEHFKGKALNKSLNPDEAIAYGAAVQAALLNSKLENSVFDFGRIQEVTPMSLGIELASKEMDIIISKNLKIPVTHTEKYQTNVDGQTTVNIVIFQGDKKIARENKLLGEFKLSGIPKGPAGKETIDVTMKINQNGILTVTASCRGTKKSNSITVSEQRVGLTEKEKLALKGKRIKSLA